MIKKIDKKQKFMIIIIYFIISLGIYYVCCFTFKKNLITYDTKYVTDNGDYWVKFYKDGKCERSIKGIKECSYTIEKDNLVLNEVQDVYGELIDMTLKFKIINKKELTHYLTCSPLATKPDAFLNCDREPDINVHLSIYNEYIEKEQNNASEEENKVDNDKNVVVKDTKMMHIEDNFYYVCFSNDSTEKVIFEFSENYTYKAGYYKLKMNITSAKYELKNILNGTYYADNKNIYIGKAIFPIVFGPEAGVGTQIFEFSNTECTIADRNPINDKEAEQDKDKNTNDNSINNKYDENTNNNDNKSNTYYDDNNDSLTNYNQMSKENLDKIKVSLSHYQDNQYHVNIDNNDYNNLTVLINGKSYESNNINYIYLTYEKNGNNCIDIELKDYYDNTRKFHECIDFIAEKPNYKTSIYNIEANGRCDMRLYNNDLLNGKKYNNDKLTCTINGKDHECKNGTAFYLNKGNYKLTIKNMYGVSEEIDVFCGEN